MYRSGIPKRLVILASAILFWFGGVTLGEDQIDPSINNPNIDEFLEPCMWCRVTSSSSSCWELLNDPSPAMELHKSCEPVLHCYNSKGPNGSVVSLCEWTCNGDTCYLV